MFNATEIDIRLRKKQHDLEQRAQKLSEELSRQHMDLSKDSEDQAQELENEEVAQALVQETQQELQQVKHAILRLKQGVYAQCELCQQPIETDRLLALPYTALCYSCASEQ